MRPDIQTILQLTSGYRFPEFFSIFKSFLSLVFPGRVESYIEESYVIDTADDIVFGYMNNSVFMLSRVALFYVHSYGCIYSLMLNKLSSGQAKLFCCFGF